MTDTKPEDDQQPDDKQPEVEEVVTEFDGIRLRSTFRIVEEAPGQLSFSIEGPVFDMDEEEEPEEQDQ
jgi:hypothetical protein